MKFIRSLGCLRIALVSTLVVIASSSAAYARMAERMAAYGRADYATGPRAFYAFATKGNPQPQVNLGFMYQNGQGVVKDDTEAVKWFQKAAEQGMAAGEHNLGVAYERVWESHKMTLQRFSGIAKRLFMDIATHKTTSKVYLKRGWAELTTLPKQ